MENLQELAALRNKGELVSYFKQNNIDLKEEDILDLKKQYNNSKTNESNLTMSQLDIVQGGIMEGCHNRSAKFAIGATLFSLATIGVFRLVQYLTDKNRCIK